MRLGGQRGPVAPARPAAPLVAGGDVPSQLESLSTNTGIEILLALGGLPESGRSTTAEYLRVRHGFARLKIGFLIETAAALHGTGDPYAADPVARG